MARRSAGLLMYRQNKGTVEVLLVHPGGPYWLNKDLGAWSIPKGEYDQTEDPLEAAQREFREETGIRAVGPFYQLTALTQPSGKVIEAWAFAGDCDARLCTSTTFLIEWPPRSGQQQEFPEVDRAEWFPLDHAKEKVVKGQRKFLEELQRHLARRAV